MGKKWTVEELKVIKELYESGLRLHDVFLKFKEIYGEKRTEGAIWIAIKRHKYKHTKECTCLLKSQATSGKNNPMYGKPSWRKGLTKEIDERIKIGAEKMSNTRKEMFRDGLLDVRGENNPMYGKAPWCKGLTKETDIRVKKLSKKISILKKKQWSLFSDEEKNAIIGRMTLASNKSKKNARIELKVKQVLEILNVDFIQQHRNSRFVFDFFLPKYNFVIECQGDYWHGNPNRFVKLNDIQKNNIIRDVRKIEFLKENKIHFLFMWETEINANFEELINTIDFKIHGEITRQQLKPTFEQ